MRGVTLVELLVVLTVVGLLLGLAGLAVGSLKLPRESLRRIVLRTGRAAAIHSGVPHAANGVRFLPDGRVIGAEVDPLTGTPLDR